MDTPTIALVVAVAGLAFAAAQWRQRRPQLRIEVFPSRSDGTYARGRGGCSHLACEVLNTGSVSVVLRGVGYSSRIRVSPEPGESATLAQETIHGDVPVELRPGYSSRFVVPLERILIDLEHEFESIWAQSTGGRRFPISARWVLWVQEQLFESYCIDHAA